MIKRLRICDDEEIQIQIDARINRRYQRTAVIIAVPLCGGSMWREHHSQLLGDVHLFWFLELVDLEHVLGYYISSLRV